VNRARLLLFALEVRCVNCHRRLHEAGTCPPPEQPAGTNAAPATAVERRKSRRALSDTMLTSHLLEQFTDVNLGRHSFPNSVHRALTARSYVSEFQ
jgi:hypothetical protein